MSTPIHGISWNIISYISFVTCRHCQVKPEQAGVKSKYGRRHFWYMAISKCWFILKSFWHILMLIAVLQQMAEFIYNHAITDTTFQSVLKGLHWRVKQVTSMIILWIIVTGQEKMEKVCLQRRLLENEILNFCSGHEHRRTLLDGIRRFGLIFNCISLVLLFLVHLEVEAEHSVRFSKIPYLFWPFFIPTNFWLFEMLLLLTTDMLTFLPYFFMVWWCTLVQAGVQFVMTFRQQLKLTKSPTNDLEKLQNILSTLQSFHATMEESFSGILFWHIGSAVLTSFSFLGDIVNGTDSAHWFSAFVAPQMLIWNTVFLVGIPNLFSIRFQEETELLLDDMTSCLKCCPIKGVNADNADNAERSQKIEFKLDLMAMQRKPLVFTASRYFSLDKNFIITFVGCVATYAVIIREFLKDELPALENNREKFPRNCSFS